MGKMLVNSLNRSTIYTLLNKSFNLSCLLKQCNISKKFSSSIPFSLIKPDTHEITKVASEAEYIAGISAVIFSITLVGLALGFVLLRIEALIDDEKIKL